MDGTDEKAKQRVTNSYLIRRIQEVRKATGGSVPLSPVKSTRSGSTHPELVDAVDFIAIHVLPYWEGTKAENAVESTIAIYNKVKAAYPNKHVKISEFGWPSAGFNRHGANPVASSRRRSCATSHSAPKPSTSTTTSSKPTTSRGRPSKAASARYWGAIDSNRQMKFRWSGRCVTKLI